MHDTHRDLESVSLGGLDEIRGGRVQPSTQPIVNPAQPRRGRLRRSHATRPRPILDPVGPDPTSGGYEGLSLRLRDKLLG
jgi:hypothetical protein